MICRVPARRENFGPFTLFLVKSRRVAPGKFCGLVGGICLASVSTVFPPGSLLPPYIPGSANDTHDTHSPHWTQDARPFPPRSPRVRGSGAGEPPGWRGRVLRPPSRAVACREWPASPCVCLGGARVPSAHLHHTVNVTTQCISYTTRDTQSSSY